jgi:putative endonuclease
MFIVYIIYSSSLDRYYVGQTDDFDDRLEHHNAGESPYTSRVSDWILKYTEFYQSRGEAKKREFAIKRKKSRKYIEWLINGDSQEVQSASSRQKSG